MPKPDFTFRLHPEKNIDHFTACDGTLKFFGFVKATMLRTSARHVLDFGAGRGAWWHDDPSKFRKQMRDLRMGGNAVVTACDIDPVVLTHPCSDTQIVIDPNERVPFADGTFDVIVSDMTFEHIENPGFVSRELVRILKPGGHICARTANRWGYVRLMSRLIPNKMHVSMLQHVQPDRRGEDVFPTRYQLNSPAQIRRWFPSCKLYYYYDSAEPAYYFGTEALYSALALLHRLTPGFLATSLCAFIRKPCAEQSSRFHSEVASNGAPVDAGA
jgi:SAM-dependent methyltransferase